MNRPLNTFVKLQIYRPRTVEFLVLVLYLGVQTLENRENLAFEGLGGILVRV